MQVALGDPSVSLPPCPHPWGWWLGSLSVFGCAWFSVTCVWFASLRNLLQPGSGQASVAGRDLEQSGGTLQGVKEREEPGSSCPADLNQLLQAREPGPVDIPPPPPCCLQQDLSLPESELAKRAPGTPLF